MGAASDTLAASGSPRPRLVFEPSGLEVACIGLGRAHLRDLTARWCCTLDDGPGSAAKFELRIVSNGDRPDPFSAIRTRLHEEQFGHWRTTIRPGIGCDDVGCATRSAATSGDFFQAVDLCVTHLLALQGGTMLHGAAVELGGAGVLAVGYSGSGKSTLAAAALAAGGAVVSDDLLLAGKLPSGEISLATMRRAMVLREAGFQILSQDFRELLKPYDIKGKRRWQLSQKDAPSAFTEWIDPRHLWLVSVDRRLGSSRVEGVDQAAALAWLIRGTTDRFLTEAFPRERDAQLQVLKTLAEARPACRIRLGRDLLTAPAATLEHLLSASVG